MEYERVVAAIERGSVAPAYVLYGPDRHARSAVLAALRLRLSVGQFGEITLEGGRASAAEAAAMLAAPSLAGGRLVVCLDLPADPPEALLRWLDHPGRDAVLVVCCASLDRRRRLSKRLIEVGAVIECRAPKPAESLDWLRRRGVPARVAQLLVQRLPADLDRYERELDKLQTFGRVDAAAVEALVPLARDERAFDLLDALGGVHPGAAIELARTLCGQQEEPLGLLALLAHHLRLVLRAGELMRRGLSPERIATELGAHPFVVRRALEQTVRFRAEELAAGLETLWKAERAVKTGARDDATALELALAALSVARERAPAGSESLP